MSRPMFWGVMRLAACALAFSTSACEPTVPECEQGELVYRGRPPRHLFRQDCSCRTDCFSLPQQGEGCLEEAAYRKCSQDCGWVRVEEPRGELRATMDYFDLFGKSNDERTLVLVDASSMADDGRALVFEFGYLDGLDGEAPVDFGFMRSGPRTYLSDRVFSSAVFRMRVGVAKDLNEDGVYNLDDGICRTICEADEMCGEHQACIEGICTPTDEGLASGAAGTGLRCAATAACEPNQVCVGGREVEAAAGDVVWAQPGRLDIELTGDNRLRGRFYLGFKTPTGQPQGEILGCFDLRATERPHPLIPRRLLVP